jgi:hypothetical protein
MMIGGEAAVVQRLDPIFATLAPGIGNIPRTPGREKLGGTAEQGYLHCGPNGAGHFVKMVHNGIEYGIMAAYAEGLGVLKAANAGTTRSEADAETTPLRNPEHYQVRINCFPRCGLVSAGTWRSQPTKSYEPQQLSSFGCLGVFRGDGRSRLQEDFPGPPSDGETRHS